MDLVQLTESIIKSIVKDSDSVSIKKFENEDIITIEVLVASTDIGLIIGSKGRTVNAIRTVVQTVAYSNSNKKVVINIDTV